MISVEDLRLQISCEKFHGIDRLRNLRASRRRPGGFMTPLRYGAATNITSRCSPSCSTFDFPQVGHDPAEQFGIELGELLARGQVDLAGGTRAVEVEEQGEA